MSEIAEARKTTVLVVDDVHDNLILISLSLQDMGYRVLTADNGEEAVAMAVRARPDIILMDIAMPELDGLGAARRIRSHVEVRGVPIIGITAFTTGGFRKAAFDAGFDGYLTKPLDFDQLNKLIEMLLPGEEDTSDLTHEETTEVKSEETTGLASHN
ncbi:MAG TPA: response regulator [Pyrinomonadaceae bacterium]|jgi:CheY-like chemotaxis protein|nr:response regulator [Pyrinomonadaceae bacterium]